MSEAHGVDVAVCPGVVYVSVSCEQCVARRIHCRQLAVAVLTGARQIPVQGVVCR